MLEKEVNSCNNHVDPGMEKSDENREESQDPAVESTDENQTGPGSKINHDKNNHEIDYIMVRL